MSVTTVSRDQILAGMLTALTALVPASGGPLAPSTPFYSAARFVGLENLREMFQNGAGGRTPAVQVEFKPERRLKTTIGRRVDKVEGTYIVHVITDRMRYRQSRDEVLALADLARSVIAGHMFGLAIRGMVYEDAGVTIDVEKAIAYSVRFTTVYRTDYTKLGPFDTLTSASGNVFNGGTDDGDSPSTIYGDIAVTLQGETS